jgi:hypothetical protein
MGNKRKYHGEACCIEGCDKAAKVRGMCARHYTEAWSAGKFEVHVPIDKTPHPCPVCGEPAKWYAVACSVGCGQAMNSEKAQERRKRVCEQCGKVFVKGRNSGKANRGEVQEGRFCSHKCRGIWWSAKCGRLEVGGYKIGACSPVYIKACALCGKLFAGRFENQRLCGDDCKYEEFKQHQREGYASRYEAKTLECHFCGESFTTELGTLRRAYCTDDCARRANKTGSHRKRARQRGAQYEPVDRIAVFERDGWRCQLCGKKLRRKHVGMNHPDAPELDHIVPLGAGGDHLYRNVQCSCRRCNGRKGSKVVGQLRLFG